MKWDRSHNALALVAITFLGITIPSLSASSSLSFVTLQTTGTTTNTTSQNAAIQQMSATQNQQISPDVREFIMDQIVNNSKSAIVIGFVGLNGANLSSFGNISESNNTPVNGSTLFNIDSITKTFTTLALADMVNQGIINLSDPIKKYLPYNVTVPQFNGVEITIEDLAIHTSGLPYVPPNIWINNTVGNMNPDYNVTQLYQALSNTTLTREPGTKWEYSDFGLGLLGHILTLQERGMPYEQVIKNRILDVLGMNDTKITLSENDIKDRFPVGHQNGTEVETPQIPDVIAGAGSLRSTGNDMLKYLSANLGLLHSTLDDSIQLQHLIRHPGINANPMNYSEYVALGPRVLTDLGTTEVITHQGAIEGWNSFIGFIPSRQIGVILLCSCDETDANMNNLGFVLLNLAGSEILDNEISSTTQPSAPSSDKYPKS
jgi:serine-type D-Ala-D-Ala carboxypeptidase/endopeptidase